MKLWFTICVIVAAATWVGGAHAQLIEGTSSGEVLVGTDNGDRIYGYGGADTLRGKGGGDLLVGGSGADTLECNAGYDNPQGGWGEDLIYCDAQDGKPDVIDCGPSEDIVFWRVEGTVIASNCETAIRVTATGDRLQLAEVCTIYPVGHAPATSCQRPHDGSTGLLADGPR